MDRVQRLRQLTADLERLPASEARDALLQEVRRRAVAVETGEKPKSAWQSTPHVAVVVPNARDSAAGHQARRTEALLRAAHGQLE
jgi:hypothetical protein